jgi:hypothetical protein
MGFDFNKRCAGDPVQKKAWHAAARKQLKALAKDLGFPAGSFDLRSNLGGSAVSGEVTLHHGDVYIQASQPMGGNDTGLLIRTCESRKDFTGGRNHFTPLSWLDDSKRPELVKRVRQIIEQKTGHDADANPDPGYNAFLSTPVRVK